MRSSTRDFLNVEKAVDESRHIARAHLWAACAKASFTVTTHSVNVASVALDKHSVFLATADVCHHDVEAAHLWQVVDNFLTADAQLSMVVV